MDNEIAKAIATLGVLALTGFFYQKDGDSDILIFTIIALFFIW
jgi:hypothetical protein